MPLFPPRKQSLRELLRKRPEASLSEAFKSTARLFPWNVVSGNIPGLGILTTIPQMMELRGVAERLTRAEAFAGKLALRAVGNAIREGRLSIPKTPAAQISRSYALAFSHSSAVAASRFLRRPIMPRIPKRVAEKLPHRRPFAFAYARH